ncbi:MAG TPA: M23 family metallopeptidase [Beijerinckiaceae bacterium]|nr:M23 family metallopeptidase [Beijerinckiaceae bacterium]
MTGSLADTPRPKPRATVQSMPLAAPQPHYQPQPQYQPQRMSPAHQLPAPIARTAALPAPRQPVAASGPGGWSAHGGTAVIVGPGENLNMIANRYGVPASAILSANRLASAAQVTAGRQIIIPVYNAEGTPAAAAPLRQAMPAEPAKPPLHGGRVTAQPRPAGPQTLAWNEPPPARQPAIAARPAAPAQAAPPRKEPESTSSLPPSDGTGEFRWPAHGRVISGFGGASANEGINIAVPEGTPVKAAESGTVAYAGSEVKGYGNLVLVRHESGYVSAYAHNSEITVKRGDKVRRGQVIAKSGQTGNVTSPQLHFEIRKGSTPIDPIPFLSRG